MSRSSEAVIRWQRRTKAKLVKHKGGKCEICGYDKNQAALEFHHLNPKQKVAGIIGSTLSFSRQIQEVEKCRLVCANCHAEFESVNT